MLISVRRCLPWLTAAAFLLAWVPAAQAARHTFFVSPAGSDAVSCAANASAAPFATIQRAVSCAGDGDVISLAASGSTPYPGIGSLTANVTIRAATSASARTVTIDTGADALNVAPGANATVSGVTLNCISSCGGSPTVTNHGTLLLSKDTVTGNTNIPVSAILNATPDDSSSSSTLTIQNSTIANNDSRLGGAIQTATGTNATGATILTITNSTIANNVSLQQGGGIAALASTTGSSTTITASTITANNASSGGGLYASTPVTLTNTIIAANTIHSGTATDCQSSSGGTTITDGPGGHNLIGNATGCGTITPGTNHDQAGSTGAEIDPQLGPLAYNNGPTQTEPPLADSPALGAGDAGACLTQPIFNSDQRQQSRNAASRDVCDVGADDTGADAPPDQAPAIVSAASRNGTVGSPLAFSVRTTASPTAALSLTGALPPGITFSDRGTGAGVLAGTPQPGSQGSYPLAITAKNGAGSPATQSLVLTIEPLSVSRVAPVTIAQGASMVSLTITGTGFKQGATIAASDPGVTFSSVVVKSRHTIVVGASVPTDTPTGALDVSVTEPGTSAICTGCLSVLAP